MPRNGQAACWQGLCLPISLIRCGTAKLYDAKTLNSDVQSVAVTRLTQILFSDCVLKLMEMELLVFKENNILPSR